MRRGPAITASFEAEASVSPYRPGSVPADELGGQSTCIVSEWVVVIPVSAVWHAQMHDNSPLASCIPPRPG